MTATPEYQRAPARSTTVEPRVSRLNSIVEVAWLDALDRTSHDVVVGVVTGLVPGTAVGALTGQWGLVLVIGLAAFVGYFLAVFLDFIVRYSTGWNSCWVQTTQVSGGAIRFQLERSSRSRSLQGVV